MKGLANIGIRHTLRRLRSRLRPLFVRRGPAALSGSGSYAVAPPSQAGPDLIRLADLVASGPEKYVVFFAPEAGVVPHFIATCFIAKTLEELGYKTLIVRCFDIYPRCVVMDGEGLPHDLNEERRRSVCERCFGHSNLMTGSYNLSVVDLRDLVDDEIKHQVETLTSNLPDDLTKFAFEGVRFGQICGAEAAIAFKTSDVTGATPDVRQMLVWYLKGALLSFLATKRLLQSKKISRIVYFNEYAILLAAALAAREAGVPITNMTMASIRGVDRRRIIFMKEPLAILSYRKRLESWKSWRDLVLPELVIKAVTDDCLYRMSSSSPFVYSPGRTGTTDDVFTSLGLDKTRKLLVAFTSSLDELTANNQYLGALGFDPYPTRQPFKDQIEWLTALIGYVEPSSDLQLVVRVHPREDANKRDGVVSDHLAVLKLRFESQDYKHIRFIWPQDKVSSYDLMELADVGLSAWSSTALEMARMGVPVLSAFDLHTPFPTGDVVAWADTPDGYFDLLKRATGSPPNLDKISFAYRWSSLRTLGCALDLSDSITDAEITQLPKYIRPLAAAEIEDALINDRDVLDITRQKLLAAQSQSHVDGERAALLRQLRRCVWFLCTGEDRPSDYRLFFGSHTGEGALTGDDAVLVEREGLSNSKPPAGGFPAVHGWLVAWLCWPRKAAAVACNDERRAKFNRRALRRSGPGRGISCRPGSAERGAARPRKTNGSGQRSGGKQDS